MLDGSTEGKEMWLNFKATLRAHAAEVMAKTDVGTILRYTLMVEAFVLAVATAALLPTMLPQ